MTSVRAQAQAVLRYPDVWRFVSARFLATLAAQMQIVAVGWQMYAITGDPLDLGLDRPVAVHSFRDADPARRPRRGPLQPSRIVTFCYLTEAVCAVLLLTMTLRGVHTTWPIFLAMVLLGCARAFSMPGAQSLLPNLVPPEFFTRAVALNSSAFQVASVIGPALGGLLYLAGPAVVYGAVLVLAIVASLLMVQVRGGTAHTNAAREPATLADIAVRSEVRALATGGDGRDFARFVCCVVRRRDGAVADVCS